MPSETYRTLYRLIDTLPVVSSHEHHQTDDFQRLVLFQVGQRLCEAYHSSIGLLALTHLHPPLVRGTTLRRRGLGAHGRVEPQMVTRDDEPAPAHRMDTSLSPLR